MIHIKPTFFLLTCESAASGLQAPNLKKKKIKKKNQKKDQNVNMKLFR